MYKLLSSIARLVDNATKVERLERDICQIHSVLANRQEEKRERRKEWLWNLMAALLSGAIIAWVSVWFANNSNRKNLDSRLEVNFGAQNKFGTIPVSSDSVKIYIENIGPNDVQSVQLDVQIFHSNYTLDRIDFDGWPLKPLQTIKKMKVGETLVLDLKESGFNWAAPFINAENPKLRDLWPKDLLLFCKLSAKYNRSWDNKSFRSGRIYHVTRTAIVPWTLPLNRDRFVLETE